MIKEASIYVLKNMPEDERKVYGLLVLTTRYRLRFVSNSEIDMWIPDAGPSATLLQDWRQKRVVHWTDFVERYEAEQRAYRRCGAISTYSAGTRVVKPADVSPVMYLARLASTQVVTVLCWEQDEKCHRFTLVKLIEEQMGVSHV